ncbi:hypothetical protein K1719_025860 [Acacia pycnantha]|nr:hypothetical protein K1719_025860 [Acacia pycnantha]
MPPPQKFGRHDRKKHLIRNLPQIVALQSPLDPEALTCNFSNTSWTLKSRRDRPVEWGDAAAIQAAEVRATGRTTIVPDGVARPPLASAATLNARLPDKAEKTTLADILKDAISKLPLDKVATRENA